MLENHLATPFATEVLTMIVMVEAVDMTDDEETVAMCVRDNSRKREQNVRTTARCQMHRTACLYPAILIRARPE
jgi:hypothetical protein